jgi:hypothetical protein
MLLVRLVYQHNLPTDSILSLVAPHLPIAGWTSENRVMVLNADCSSGMLPALDGNCQGRRTQVLVVTKSDIWPIVYVLLRLIRQFRLLHT